MRSDGLWTSAHRQLPLVPVRRPPGPSPPLARPAGDLGDEHHRHRRQDHPGRGRCRDRDRRTRRPAPGAVPRRRGGPAHDPARRPAPGHRPHRRDGRLDRDPARAWICLSHRRWLDLLPDRIVAGVRATRPPRSRRAEGRRAGRGRRIRQGRRSRLRPVEGAKARRTIVGDLDRARPAGLAHRVLGDEHGATSGRRSISTPAAST